MKEIIYCCSFNLFQWKRNPKIISIMFLITGYFYSIINPISQFSAEIKCNATPWLFPFITSEPNCILVLMVIYVLLICDAPFLYKYQKYLIIRIGKNKWIYAQLLYIGFATILYWLFVLANSMIWLIPHIDFSSGWGKVLSTLAQVRLGGNNQLFFSINYKILLLCPPRKAMLISFFLATMVSLFIGFIVFLLNMSKQKQLGTVFALVAIIIQHFAFLANGYWLFSYSPVSWISMNVVNFSKMKTNMPSFEYVLFTLLGLILITITAILEKNKRKATDLLA